MRSYLYVPAISTKRLKKAATLDADALIFDLEDSATEGQKETARQNLAEALKQDFKAREILVRINGTDSPEYGDDLAFITACCAAENKRIDGVVLPKADARSQLTAFDAALSGPGTQQDLALWAMIETPLAVLHADRLAASTPRLKGFILGLEDLSAALGGISLNKDRSNISYAMQRVVMAAKAYDMLAIDAVCTDYQNHAALKTAARQSRDLGYDGKSLIHPCQIEAANEIYGVSQAELDQAHKLIDAYEEALSQGKAVAGMDGQMIEALHFETAKQTVLAYRAQNTRKKT